MVVEKVDREIKKELIEILESKARDKLHYIADWLWEDYGLRVKTDWESVRKTILKSREISSRELAVLMINLGVDVDEDIWLKRMRSRR